MFSSKIRDLVGFITGTGGFREGAANVGDALVGPAMARRREDDEKARRAMAMARETGPGPLPEAARKLAEELGR